MVPLLIEVAGNGGGLPESSNNDAKMRDRTKIGAARDFCALSHIAHAAVKPG
jgi:hypothetical protein